jgi:hypothetical protein
MSNSEQVAHNKTLQDFQERMFGNTTYKIDVEFHGVTLEVEYELFNHDDETTFSILSAYNANKANVLSLIEWLGGLSELCEIVEKLLMSRGN